MCPIHIPATRGGSVPWRRRWRTAGVAAAHCRGGRRRSGEGKQVRRRTLAGRTRGQGRRRGKAGAAAVAAGDARAAAGDCRAARGEVRGGGATPVGGRAQTAAQQQGRMGGVTPEPVKERVGVIPGVGGADLGRQRAEEYCADLRGGGRRSGGVRGSGLGSPSGRRTVSRGRRAAQEGGGGGRGAAAVSRGRRGRTGEGVSGDGVDGGAVSGNPLGFSRARVLSRGGRNHDSRCFGASVGIGVR
ncbi:hypothetical protein PVAP13_2KG040516 [Panicum virgatum]|uniref:Uncharacterized protein n=1 Tax=Panicum virgatum TaxID=38727 RepID=A0A8T0W1C4_PANVG|nr:hypothetical protein PVAP13_2KG040516 [Panicum virgatum]